MNLTMILVIGAVVLVVLFLILAGATLLGLGQKHETGHLSTDKRPSASRKGGGGQGAPKKKRKH